MAQAGPVSSPSGRFPALAKYEIQEELGHGGMATVYRAHDARLGRDVAIKVLHPHLRDNQEIGHRFATEAKAVAKLRHPNIVEVFDVSEVGDGERYLVVELVRGTTLRALLTERGALPPEIAAAIALEILAALSAAHGEGVVHRDVKPENVLMEHPLLRRREQKGDRTSDPKGDGANGEKIDSIVPRSNPNDTQLRIKLTDFGIAKLLDAQGVTSTGQVLGSPAHMAPEQIDGGDVDERADVFGVGVLLYECMVGHLPFEGSNPAQVLRRVLEGVYSPAERDRPVVGRDWSRLVDRALMLDPNERFPNALAMREAIQTQFKFLGIEDPRADLEAYFRDPAGFEAKHAEKLLTKLQEMGAEARKRGDVQGAANAYNRALAYAPNDTNLLRVVATLARAEDRRRMLRRSATPAMAILALGLSAFGVTRLLTQRPVPKDPVTPVKTAVTVTSTAITAEPTASAPAPKATLSKLPPRTMPSVAASVPRPPKLRTVTLVATEPPVGVLCAIDKESPRPVTAGEKFELSDGPHDFVFTCVDDMCFPQSPRLGPNDDSLSVAMKIRDARIVVDGPVSGTYGLTQRPDVVLRPGVPVSVPMGAGTEPLTVVERGSGKTVTISARAGKEVHVPFPDIP